MCKKLRRKRKRGNTRGNEGLQEKRRARLWEPDTTGTGRYVTGFEGKRRSLGNRRYGKELSAKRRIERNDESLITRGRGDA